MKDKRLSEAAAAGLVDRLMHWERATPEEQAAWLLGYAQAIDELIKLLEHSTAPLMVNFRECVLKHQQEKIDLRIASMKP